MQKKEKNENLNVNNNNIIYNFSGFESPRRFNSEGEQLTLIDELDEKNVGHHSEEIFGSDEDKDKDAKNKMKNSTNSTEILKISVEEKMGFVKPLKKIVSKSYLNNYNKLNNNNNANENIVKDNNKIFEDLQNKNNIKKPKVNIIESRAKGTVKELQDYKITQINVKIFFLKILENRYNRR
mgnify:CR=1 FL=1